MIYHFFNFHHSIHAIPLVSQDDTFPVMQHLLKTLKHS